MPAPVEPPTPKPAALTAGLSGALGEAQDEKLDVKIEGSAVVITLHINFAFNKATVDSSEKSKITGVAVILTKHPDLKVRVEGYTDNVGDAKVNQKLSLLRANEVATTLAGLGVAPERIAAVGKGKSKPIASNSTPKGRAKNRRVVFVIEN